MITKEITLCSKQVTLAYCYATEIAFRTLSDEDINDFMAEAFNDVQAQKMPDIRKSIYLIIAAMVAYYDRPEKCPIQDTELMKEATPNDVGTALGIILSLRAEFYHVPKGEPEDKPNEREEKNV